MENNHVGECHGIFTIVQKLNYKDKYHHTLYKCRCNVCGFEKKDSYSRISSPNRITKFCIHKKPINIKYCLFCGKEIPIARTDRSVTYNKKKFCCHSCSAAYSNKNRSKNPTIRKCLNCGIEIKSLKYCSQKCKNEYNQKIFEEKWLNGEVSGNTDGPWTEPVSGVRKYLFKKYNNKCSKCGWGEMNQFTGKIPLEVEHIDGNANNTTPDNVTLLCHDCHSLTSTYRGANRGNGRPKTWTPKNSGLRKDNFVV